MRFKKRDSLSRQKSLLACMKDKDVLKSNCVTRVLEK